MRQQMVNDYEYAAKFADALMEGIGSLDFYGVSEDEDGNGPEVNTTETFEEALLLTSDKGLVLEMSDGAQVHLTITAYVPVRKGETT